MQFYYFPKLGEKVEIKEPNFSEYDLRQCELKLSALNITIRGYVSWLEEYDFKIQKIEELISLTKPNLRFKPDLETELSRRISLEARNRLEAAANDQNVEELHDSKIEKCKKLLAEIAKVEKYIFVMNKTIEELQEKSGKIEQSLKMAWRQREILKRRIQVLQPDLWEQS